MRVNPGCPLTLRLIAASGFCKAEAAPRHCVGFPGVVADGAANPLLSALDPLFRVLRRFWDKPLKLQAYWPKNPGRSGSFLRNPLFLPLLPADSVRLDRPDHATGKRDKMGAVQESIKRRKKGAGNLPQLLACSRFRPPKKILDRRQDPLDDDGDPRPGRVHSVRLIEFSVACHAVEEEWVESRPGGLGDRRIDRIERAV